MTAADLLATLDAVEGRVVQLVYFDGLSTTETARRLGLEPGEVTRTLGAALRRVAGLVLDVAEPDAAATPPHATAVAG